jgi:hypothetical protein
MPRLIALTLMLALTACTEPAEPAVQLDAQQLPATVTIGEGKSVEVAGAIVGFDGVNNDSRCASDVVCVWAGNAELRLTVGPAIGLGPVHLLTLNTSLDPQTSEPVYGLVVTVVDLLPDRVSTGPTKDYRAVLRIQQAP